MRLESYHDTQVSKLGATLRSSLLESSDGSEISRNPGSSDDSESSEHVWIPYRLMLYEDAKGGMS